MASGFGHFSREGRCYKFFTDYADCIKETDDPRKCRNEHEVFLQTPLQTLVAKGASRTLQRSRFAHCMLSAITFGLIHYRPLVSYILPMEKGL